MLAMKDPKKLSAIIVSKMKPEGESMSEKMPEDGAEKSDNMGLESAAEEIMSAVESKNPKMLVEALKSFVEMCEYSKESDD